MEHAWNYIKIGGKWYHVDLTWDDPLINSETDSFGQVKHSNFMLSNEGITNTKTPHDGWNINEIIEPCDKTYDGFFWSKVDSGIFKIGDYSYYIIKDTDSDKPLAHIERYDFKTGEKKRIYTISSKWYVRDSNGITSRYYTNNFSKLAVKDNLLFFNTADGIYSIDISGNNLNTIKSINTKDKYIYGITINGDRLNYAVKEKPSEAGVVKSVKI